MAMHRYIKFALLLGLVCLCRLNIAHSLPAVANGASSVFSQLQNTGSPYNRLLLSERTKRGLFSSLAGLTSGGLAGGANKEPDEEASALKPKPYDFNEVEMTAIQAMISLRDIIGDLLQKVGFNLPSLASLITRSETDKSSSGLLSGDSASPSALSSLTSTKSNMGVQVLRGLALSLPFLIPMASQLRRMSPDTSSSLASPLMPIAQVPQMMIPDIYYNQAMHRRRGKRSLNLGHQQKHEQTSAAVTVPLFRGDASVVSTAVQHLLSSRPILRYLRQMEAKYAAEEK